MSNPTLSSGSTPKRTGGPVTVYLDRDLWAAFSALCKANPKAKSPSAVIAKKLAQEVATKGRRYGIRLPEHLATK